MVKSELYFLWRYVIIIKIYICFEFSVVFHFIRIVKGDVALTDKELRRLKRAELIEMLYYMRTEIDELKAQNQQLQTRLDAFTQKALQINDASKEDEPAQA